jgi:hypothetical protein
MAVFDNVVNTIAGINQRRRAAQVNDAAANFLTNPQEAIANVSNIDSGAGIALQDKYTAQQSAQRELQDSQRKQALLAVRNMGGMLKAVQNKGGDLGVAFDQLTPVFKKGFGMGDDELAATKASIMANPTLIDAFMQDADNELKVGTPGSWVFDEGGNIKFRIPAAPQFMKTIGPDGNETIVQLPNGSQPGPAAPAAPAGGGNLDSIWRSLIQQESGGQPGIQGQPTKYGTAQGLTQMLPATAQAMAAKTGLPWQPQMMSDTTPAGAQYQEKLGRAYFDEGLKKYNGDVRKALMYYHGGPDEKLWGPKTQAYADSVLARAGQGGGTGSAGVVYSGGTKPSNRPTYRAATREEIAAAGYPEGTAAQIDSDGKFVNIKTPTAAKPGQLTPEQKAEAKAKFTDNLMTLANAYSQLNQSGGIVDPGAGTARNTMAKVGQFIGGATGGVLDADNQSLRAQIESVRPLLINNIRQITGMSAKTMDSNAELKFYLQAASDPTKDIITNLAAIQTLDEQYGTGTALKGSLPPDLYARVVNRAAVMQKGRKGSGQANQSPGAPAVGTRARNPKTGAVVIWNGQGWAPAR